MNQKIEVKECSKCGEEFATAGELCQDCLDSLTELSDRELDSMYMENKPKHTPGPWYYASGGVWANKDGKGVVVALADREAGNGTIPTERDANMQLCAAAPELLAVMKEAQGLLDNASEELRKRYRAAIAKAEGKGE